MFSKAKEEKKVQVAVATEEKASKEKLSREDALKNKKQEEPEQLDITMKPGDYRVQVHVMEAKDIKAKGKAGGGGFLAHFEGETADPMVQVEIMGQQKVTEYKRGQLSPIFNEQLFFEYQDLKVDELEIAMIKIDLLDHDFIGSNNLLGSFSVDLAYIYKMNANHELYRMWVALTDMNDETQSINGFLKLSINVLGPGDKPPVHDPTKDLKNKNNAGQMKLFTPGRVKMQSHLIKLSIFRAEHLAPLDLIQNSIDPYIIASFAGSKAESKSMPQSRNPEFNQELLLACKVPSMNSKIKIEIWDDDYINDERVGTHYIEFKKVMNSQDGPRWANLYGPPLQAEGTYADFMTKFGDKGSTYRGRFLYSVQTYNDENPKSGTNDISFSFPSKPSPNPKEKSYMIKVALYEGIELPDLEEFCIHLTCGPYETKSKLVKNDNSRAIWNEYMPELVIRAPDVQDDIYDVIVYLSTSKNPSDRICFKRLKAKDLLDSNHKKFEIENYLLEEDKSTDPLDDEQFPGIIQMRIKMYSKDPEDNFPKDIFKPFDTYTEYLMQIHLFMGRDFPPADETGAADPFVIARCQGKKTKSRVKYETLNPGFFETVELVVSLPPIGDKNYPQPGISLLVYDEDTGILGSKKDLLGRVWIDIEKKIDQIMSPVDSKFHTVHTHHPEKWYDLIWDATNSKEGQILVAYDIIPLDKRDAFPLDKINIKPKTVNGMLSIVIIGLRDIIPAIDLIPVKKLYCKFDISGDTKDAVITNKHPVIGGSCNFLEIISLDIEVPINLNYSPVLTVYAYDNIMGILGTRLVGVTNIPLEVYCRKMLSFFSNVSQAFQKNLNLINIQPSVSPLKITIGENVSHDSIDIQLHSGAPLARDQVSQQEASKFRNKLLAGVANRTNAVEEGKDTDRLQLLQAQPTVTYSDMQVSNEQQMLIEGDAEAKLKVKDPKQQAQIEAYKMKVKADEQAQLEAKVQKNLETDSKRSQDRERSKGFNKYKKPYMEDQYDYDSQPEEELDTTPEWLIDRQTVEDELEDQLNKPPFNTWQVKRGQTRGRANMFVNKVQSNIEVTAQFKEIIKIKNKEQLSADVDLDIKEYLTPKVVVARLYILKGKSLTPKDSNTSDPYLIIKLGQTTITDKKSLRPKTNNPGFYTSYDLTTTLPGAATLTIEVWDDDGFDFPDLIGLTKIDLEDRYFNKDWKLKYPGKKPIEERTLFVPKISAPQGVIQCWLEILDAKEAAAIPRHDVSPPPQEHFEVRVIVWGTKDQVIKDEETKCNDLFALGQLNGLKLETDTHWRCRRDGSFNWRWKFPMTLPLDPDEDYGKDILTLQLWDRDIVDANDLIGEIQIPLNSEEYRMLDKAYKRLKTVTMKKFNEKTKKPIERWWVPVTHPDVQDKDGVSIPQGYVEISIEILPKFQADELANGLGRDAPNQHPVLPEPKGRFSFDIFSPWAMVKELLGPELARKICCIACCLIWAVLIIYFGVYFGGNIIAAIIGKYA